MIENGTEMMMRSNNQDNYNKKANILTLRLYKAIDDFAGNWNYFNELALYSACRTCNALPFSPFTNCVDDKC